MVKHQFSQVYDPKKTTVYNDFDETFRQLRKEAEARADELKKSKQVGKPVSNGRKQGQLQKSGLGREKKNNEGGDGDSVKGRGTANGKENTSSNLGAFDVNKLKSRSKVGKKKEKTATLDSKGSKAELKKKITKKNRVWDVSPKEAPESKLDFTGAVGENAENNVEVVAAYHGESMMDREEDYSIESEAEEEEEAGKESKPDSKKKSWISSMFQR
ncbi:putative signal recognition particle receptor, alpha subunit [Rosa chinensis]|uniref:Putative signal recognition particle receptor, alpha subunit n=1 Tax=Rosa chinensis TaxID=74649 RepID=A0A2P6PDY7_ROSCH|nr:putative signal recognition particle receptor, alpha subunit [Rosa chinensis]